MSYSALYPEIFTGRTGRELRAHPPDVREILVYFIASPLKSGYGLYKVSLGHITHDTGRPEASVRNSIDVLRALGAIEYDFDSEWVWVREMAKFQFQLPLKPNDFRIRSAKKWYDRTLPDTCPFLGQWWDRYAEDFHLESDTPPGPLVRRGSPKARGIDAPSPEAPSKGLCTVPVNVNVPVQEVLTGETVDSAFALTAPEKPAPPANVPPVKAALAAFIDAYAAATGGKKYIVHQGKDPGLLQRLINTTSLDDVLAGIRLLFASTDPRVLESARDIGALYFHFNRLRSASSKPALNSSNARLLETRRRMLGGDQ